MYWRRPSVRSYLSILREARNSLTHLHPLPLALALPLSPVLRDALDHLR